MKCSELDTFTCDEISSLTCDQIDSDKQELLLQIATGKITVSEEIWEKIKTLCENSIRLYNATAPESKRIPVENNTESDLTKKIKLILRSIEILIGFVFGQSVNITNYNVENNIYLETPAPIDEKTRDTLSHNIEEILDMLEEHKEVL